MVIRCDKAFFQAMKIAGFDMNRKLLLEIYGVAKAIRQASEAEIAAHMQACNLQLQQQAEHCGGWPDDLELPKSSNEALEKLSQLWVEEGLSRLRERGLSPSEAGSLLPF